MLDSFDQKVQWSRTISQNAAPQILKRLIWHISQQHTALRLLSTARRDLVIDLCTLTIVNCAGPGRTEELGLLEHLSGMKEYAIVRHGSKSSDSCFPVLCKRGSQDHTNITNHNIQTTALARPDDFSSLSRHQDIISADSNQSVLQSDNLQ